MKRGLTLLAICLMNHPEALAQMDLAAPFTLETTAVLPKGVRNPRFVNLFMDIQNKFDTTGIAQPLGKPLNKFVTFGDMVNGQATETGKNQIRGVLQAAGLSETDSVGNTTGQINTYADVKVPAIAIGITEKLTLAVAMPIFNVNVSVDSGFVKAAGSATGADVSSEESNAQRFANKACEPNSAVDCNETVGKLNNMVNTKLTTMGYEPVRSMNVTAIGDVQVIGKYLVMKDEVNAISLKGQVIFPTGTPPNADRAIDIPTGSGRFALGSAVVYDRQLPSDFRFNAFGNALALLPNRMDKRIPTSDIDTLSFDKESLHRNFGGQFGLGTGVDRKFPGLGVVLGAGYNLQYLTMATYGRGNYEPIRYTFLENQKPAETLHTMTLTAGFSTVEWYKDKKFVFPFQANIAYTRPLAGWNVNANDLLSGELVMFF